MSSRNNSLTIKFVYQNSTRQLRLENPITLSEFITHIRSICAIEPSQIVEFTYTDEEGDLVTFSTENEWNALVHDAEFSSFPKLQVITSPAPYVVTSTEEVSSSTQQKSPIQQEPILEQQQEPSSSTGDKPTENTSANASTEEDAEKGPTLEAIIENAETLAVQFQSILEQQPEFLDHVKKIGEQFHQWSRQQAAAQFYGCPRGAYWQGGRCGGRRRHCFNPYQQQQQQQQEEVRREQVIKEGSKVLADMGFPESDETKELLQRYEGNVERVVEILLRGPPTVSKMNVENTEFEY